MYAQPFNFFRCPLSTAFDRVRVVPRSTKKNSTRCRNTDIKSSTTANVHDANTIWENSPLLEIFLNSNHRVRLSEFSFAPGISSHLRDCWRGRSEIEVYTCFMVDTSAGSTAQHWHVHRYRHRHQRRVSSMLFTASPPSV